MGVSKQVLEKVGIFYVGLQNAAEHNLVQWPKIQRVPPCVFIKSYLSYVDFKWFNLPVFGHNFHDPLMMHENKTCMNMRALPYNGEWKNLLILWAQFVSIVKIKLLKTVKSKLEYLISKYV